MSVLTLSAFRPIVIMSNWNYPARDNIKQGGNENVQKLNRSKQNASVFPSVDELARELGVSRGAAYAGLKNGHIPSIRIGKRFIIPRVAIQDWLRNAGGKLNA